MDGTSHSVYLATESGRSGWKAFSSSTGTGGLCEGLDYIKSAHDGGGQVVYLPGGCVNLDNYFSAGRIMCLEQAWQWVG